MPTYLNITSKHAKLTCTRTYANIIPRTAVAYDYVFIFGLNATRDRATAGNCIRRYVYYTAGKSGVHSTSLAYISSRFVSERVTLSAIFHDSYFPHIYAVLSENIYLKNV